ncbi:conserved protein of unknown function (plasmid) [Rhodovastum atsumiense]|uniref:DUF927 domain-containing protein n=1 Tax=Rhodovastum atsumiense TaxID=504468 RepID=UPI002067D8D7|nr:conserved protein of unknown function [Rhodovastum atsumiense]
MEGILAITLLGLFLAAAFAGPLLDVLGESSGGLHLVGASRTGKSTAAVVAASVWGKPTADAQLHPWRGTANGLEGIAAETTDTLLILDEMGQADGREVGDVVYMLANEAGKQRASRNGAARPRQSWRALFLSTGEITLAQKMGEAGKRVMAGLEVRLVNLPADAGADMGVFQDLHGKPDPVSFADYLQAAARANHGIAARAFLGRLAQDRAANAAGLRTELEVLRDKFLAEHVQHGANRLWITLETGTSPRWKAAVDHAGNRHPLGPCPRPWCSSRGPPKGGEPSSISGYASRCELEP